MTQTQSRKKNLFQMNVDLMHGPIFRSLVLFMLPFFIQQETPAHECTAARVERTEHEVGPPEQVAL